MQLIMEHGEKNKGQRVLRSFVSFHTPDVRGQQLIYLVQTLQ